MSTRTDNHTWLERERHRDPDGWEARLVSEFGMDGALDLLSIQSHDFGNLDLRHAPFRRDPGLKFLVQQAREAAHDASERAHRIMWGAIQR